MASTALHKAAQYGKLEECVRLIHAGAEVNAFDGAHRTPLHRATINSHVECTATLIAAGADVDAVESHGRRPLHVAVSIDNVACATLLLKGGSNADAADFVGATPLHATAQYGCSRCLLLLLKAGAGVNACNRYGSTPLHKAAGTGHTKCALLLLQAGARLDIVDHDGCTPLHTAIKVRWSKVVALLAATVDCLVVPPHLLRVSDEEEEPWDSDLEEWGDELRRAQLATIAVVQGESRWRRRRPLMLIREQRRAVRDAGLVHKMWEEEKRKEKEGQGGALLKQLNNFQPTTLSKRSNAQKESTIAFRRCSRSFVVFLE